MVGPAAMKGLDLLNKMSSEKKLPKVNVPILEELLTRTSCFCGESLSQEDAVGRERRKRIESEITDSIEADALSEAASSLYFSVRSKNFGPQSRESWLNRRYPEIE